MRLAIIDEIVNWIFAVELYTFWEIKMGVHFCDAHCLVFG